MKPQNNMWASYKSMAGLSRLLIFTIFDYWLLIPHFCYKISENQVKYPIPVLKVTSSNVPFFPTNKKKNDFFYYCRPIAETMFGNEELTLHIWSHGDDWIYMWGDKASGAQPHVTCFCDLMWNRSQFVWIPPLYIQSINFHPVRITYPDTHTQQIHTTLSVFVVWRQPGLKSMCTHTHPSLTHRQLHEFLWNSIDCLYLNDGPWLWAPSHSRLKQHPFNGDEKLK